MGERLRRSSPGISCYAQCLRSSWVFRATERLLAGYTYSTIPWHDLTWTALNCSLSNWLFCKISSFHLLLHGSSFVFSIWWATTWWKSLSIYQLAHHAQYKQTLKVRTLSGSTTNRICRKLHINQNNFDTKKWVYRLFHLNGNGLEYKWECKCGAM